MKKALILLFTFIYISTVSLLQISPIFATEESSKKNTESQNDIQQNRNDDEPKEYSPASNCLLIIDLDSSRVLFEKNSEKNFNPGSLVKILTAITAIENCNNLSKKIYATQPILDDYDYEVYGNIGLGYGEKISVRNMIEAMLITDAGDCALTVAHNTVKSYDEFIRLMNETAKKAGAQNSTFTDPAGLDQKHQKTTLEDMAKILQYALKNQTFSSMISKEKIEIPSTNKTSGPRIIYNRNNFISKYYSTNYYNSDIKCAKTYYNNPEDCGMVAQYKNSVNNLLLLCAKSEYTYTNLSYNDINYLIDYVGKNFKQVTLISQNEFVYEVSIDNGYNSDRVLLVSTLPIKAKMKSDYDPSKISKEIKLIEGIRAPVKKGQFLGTATIYYGKEKCGEAKLVSYSDIERSNITYIKNKIKLFFGSGYFKLIIAVILFIFIYNVIKINRKKK